MGRAVRDGFLIGLFVVGAQLAYRLFPERFAVLMLSGLVLMIFYRKLDRIEAALSEERRRQDFARRRAGPAVQAVTVVIALVLCAFGSYAVWQWLPPLG